jgi:hypothetical protein
MNDPARRRAVAEEMEPHHSNFQPRQKDEPTNSNSEHVRSTNPGSHLDLVLSSSHYHYRRQLVVMGQFGFAECPIAVERGEIRDNAGVV